MKEELKKLWRRIGWHICPNCKCRTLPLFPQLLKRETVIWECTNCKKKFI